MAGSGSEFDSYFDKRASRFAAFYRSEPVAWLLGRGPLFERLNRTVAIIDALGAKRVLDVGCGSGPLFAPLADRGIRVMGIDPAPAMIELASREAERHHGLVQVRKLGWEALHDVNRYDVAVALGVFDYVERPDLLIRKMARAAPHVVGSFPSPGLRLGLRKLRYGARGVRVHGYRREDLVDLARSNGLGVVELIPLGRAGHLALFGRSPVPARPEGKGTKTSSLPPDRG